jgi:hypothetical protein
MGPASKLTERRPADKMEPPRSPPMKIAVLAEIALK